MWEIVCQAKGKVIGVERRKSGMVVTIFVVLTVAAIVLVVILRNMMNRNEGEEMDVSKYADRGITKAYMIADEDGELEAYDVFVTVPGYKSDIKTKVRIEKDGDELLDLQILSQDETPELGGKIVEGSFFVEILYDYGCVVFAVTFWNILVMVNLYIANGDMMNRSTVNTVKIDVIRYRWKSPQLDMLF